MVDSATELQCYEAIMQALFPVETILQLVTQSAFFNPATPELQIKCLELNFTEWFIICMLQ